MKLKNRQASLSHVYYEICFKTKQRLPGSRLPSFSGPCPNPVVHCPVTPPTPILNNIYGQVHRQAHPSLPSHPQHTAQWQARKHCSISFPSKGHFGLVTMCCLQSSVCFNTEMGRVRKLVWLVCCMGEHTGKRLNQT